MGNMKSQNEFIPFACNFHILCIAKIHVCWKGFFFSLGKKMDKFYLNESFYMGMYYVYMAKSI